MKLRAGRTNSQLTTGTRVRYTNNCEYRIVFCVLCFTIHDSRFTNNRECHMNRWQARGCKKYLLTRNSVISPGFNPETHNLLNFFFAHWATRKRFSPPSAFIPQVKLAETNHESQSKRFTMIAFPPVYQSASLGNHESVNPNSKIRDMRRQSASKTLASCVHHHASTDGRRSISNAHTLRGWRAVSR